MHPLSSEFSAALARQIAYDTLGRERPVTDTVRNPDAAIAGAGEDQPPIATECRLNLVVAVRDVPTYIAAWPSSND